MIRSIISGGDSYIKLQLDSSYLHCGWKLLHCQRFLQRLRHGGGHAVLVPAGGLGEERRDAGETSLHVQEPEADHGEDGEVCGSVTNPTLLIHVIVFHMLL